MASSTGKKRAVSGKSKSIKPKQLEQKVDAELLLRRIQELEEAVDQLRGRLIHRDEPHRVSDVDLSALSAAQDRFVRATTDGWLLVVASGAKMSLPSGLKVSLTSSSGGRDNGTVLEGVFLGTTFDVSSGNLEATFRRVGSLNAHVQRRAAGPVVIGGVAFDLELRISFIEAGTQKALGPYAAKTDPANPVPTGQHAIEIPDYPHELGSGYGAHGKVWFRIGHQGDRYVHPGRVSAGCLTCAPTQWEEIYGVLHCARLNDKVSVGTLIVQ
jgi:hypothetical protein